MRYGKNKGVCIADEVEEISWVINEKENNDLKIALSVY